MLFSTSTVTKCTIFIFSVFSAQQVVRRVRLYAQTQNPHFHVPEHYHDLFQFNNDTIT